VGHAPRINRNLVAGAALAAALSVVCYAGTVSNQFVFDDHDIIARNPLVTSDEPHLGRIFTSHYWEHVTPAGNLYRPLTILTYWLSHAAGGLDPAGYHVVNILLHALCSVLMVALAARLGLSAPSATAAGVLFATHPIHTEAVAGIVGRADLMTASCLLAALIVHTATSGSPMPRALGIAALYAAGLLSKENAIVLPGLMLAADLRAPQPGRRAWRTLLPAYAACIAVAAGWLALRAAVLPGSGGTGAAGDPFSEAPAAIRICTALGVLARYVWLLIWPVALSADYSFAQIPAALSFAQPLTLAGAALLAALIAIATRRTGRWRLASFCALFFLIAMAPVSNLLFGIGTIMGERLLYLPSAAFCMGLPALASALCLRGAPRGVSVPARRAAAAACALLALLYSARTIARAGDWKDQLTLFSVTARTSPRSAKVRYNLGRALEDAGRTAEALSAYREALAILPEYAPAHNNAGLLLAASGDLAGAREHLEAATRFDPSLVTAWVSLGAARHALGETAGARDAFQSALRLDPGEPDALYNLGSLLLDAGRPSEALTLLEAAVKGRPADPDTRHHLGLALMQSGNPAAAIGHLREALRLAPGLTEARIALARSHLMAGERERAASEAAAAAAAGARLPAELQALLPGGGP